MLLLASAMLPINTLRLDTKNLSVSNVICISCHALGRYQSSCVTSVIGRILTVPLAQIRY